MKILPLVSITTAYILGITFLISADDPIYTLTILEGWGYLFLAYGIVGTIFMIIKHFASGRLDDGN